MKLITFAIPCYNSQDYMHHCLDTILTAKEDIEIIVVNDGSKDNTGKIADEYAKKYPDVIKVIHQENGGHGEGVNQGIRHATGLYYKVVDSDDWVDQTALKKLIKKIKKFQKEDNLVDLIIANYVYERENEQKVINYKSVFPVEKVFDWNDVGKFKVHQNILMHSVFYKTSILKECGVELPKHTFYVDNIFVYYPLPSVKTMYYMDVDFYRYFIGREDQSVNEKVMIKRIDQQIFVTRTMLDFFNPYDFEKEYPKLTTYLLNYISMMVCICSILALISNTEENLAKRKKLWEDLKQYDPRLYKHIRSHSVATLTRLPRFIAIPGYHVAQKIYKFN